jgi:hypothetical protein
MRVIFSTFTRAFFAESQLMSMAEMIKSFQFYFLSNDPGLIYDVLRDDFERTFLAPAGTSALLSANAILTREGLRPEPVFSAPLKGLFAK